jgi:hypothetical protein
LKDEWKGLQDESPRTIGVCFHTVEATLPESLILAFVRALYPFRDPLTARFESSARAAPTGRWFGFPGHLVQMLAIGALATVAAIAALVGLMPGVNRVCPAIGCAYVGDVKLPSGVGRRPRSRHWAPVRPYRLRGVRPNGRSPFRAAGPDMSTRIQSSIRTSHSPRRTPVSPGWSRCTL